MNDEPELIYFNPDHSSAEVYVRYGNVNDQLTSFLLVTKKPIYMYKKIALLEPGFAWASWGKTPYDSTTMLESIFAELDLKNHVVKSRWLSKSDVVGQNYDFFTITDVQGLAKVKIEQWVGFSFWYDNTKSSWYFIVWIYQKGETWSSFSGRGINVIINLWHVI